ncbi:hypothetical protein HDU90_004091 [Geranomyces variabilis]|nr:hypothetical protein HDU90_004091 [Geranomyces variabilis]
MAEDNAPDSWEDDVKLLKRPGAKLGGVGMERTSSSSSSTKSLADREQEYAQARARIFAGNYGGDAAPPPPAAAAAAAKTPVPGTKRLPLVTAVPDGKKEPGGPKVPPAQPAPSLIKKSDGGVVGKKDRGEVNRSGV